MSLSQQQLNDQMQVRMKALEDRQDAADRMRQDTYKMVAHMHGALMEPQPGHDGRSLVERMAEVTIDIESGKRTAENMVTLAKWFTAIGALVAFIASLKLGFWAIPKE